jgi:CDP-diacylglycerol--serine O-phosphatidyltransferase
MSIKKHIPNMITCGNLFCGCLAIVCAFNGNLVWSAYLVGIAAVLDFFDGFVARLLKVGGELGKQLDSLADMVTFGVVPGVVMYHLLRLSFTTTGGGWVVYPPLSALANTTPAEIHPVPELLTYAAFLITIFSALRLAKFNIDTRQTTSFIGVPTPANSILICSFPLILGLNSTGSTNTIKGLEYEEYFFSVQPNSMAHDILLNPYFLVCLTLLMSYLLVAELPLFALKFKNFGWTDNKIRYSFLIISVVLLILFQFVAIPFIIFLYIVMSVINNMMHRVNE